jgi:hypothetical protein
MDERVTWVYWVSRDSVDDVLSDKCTLWYERPTRVKLPDRVMWAGAAQPAAGRLGEFSLGDISVWFRVYPETDRELVRVETRPSAAELAKAQGR